MVWTPIPESVGDAITGGLSSSWGLLAWRLLIIVVGGGLVLAMVAAGGLVGIVAALVIGIALGTVLREAVGDVWNLNFYEV
jgi:hypothetical protein